MSSICCAQIDLERFKNINDGLGRPAGDALLRQVAEWLTQNVGDANLLARVGADHFAVVLPEVEDEGDVARLLEKTIENLLDHPFRVDDAGFRIAAKFGSTRCGSAALPCSNSFIQPRKTLDGLPQGVKRMFSNRGQSIAFARSGW